MLDTVFTCPVRGKPVNWEAKDVFNPAAVVRDGKVYLLYRAEDCVGRHAGTSRIGLAESTDGRSFVRRPAPVLYPDNDNMRVYEWEGGCEDPRVVEDEHGRYVMTYTAYDGTTARLAVATSWDLVTWEKQGLAFGTAAAGAYRDLWSKSGSIICGRKDDRLITTRINGSYWMYWGESNMYLATSNDLIHWDIVPGRDTTNAHRTIFSPRTHRFDSVLVEPGPPAVLTDEGIVLLYNCKNSNAQGDPNLPEGTYAPGQILFDERDPSAVLRRSVSPFMQPERPYEITGQVGNVCFVEGLVHLKNEWLLYYGTADSSIAVATASSDT